jgi:hypothetical protein
VSLFSKLARILGAAMVTSTVGCTDRVIVEEDPLGGIASEEAMCQRYCEVLNTCDSYGWDRCLGECNHPHNKWPWLTDECLDLRRTMIVCYAGYTCEDYGRRGREGDPCLDEQYNWEAAGYECFGQYLESEGWQASSSSGP